VPTVAAARWTCPRGASGSVLVVFGDTIAWIMVVLLPV
jgi:hypothetical protein